VLEHYRETHEAIFRYKGDDASKQELSKFLIDIGESLRDNKSVEISRILHSKDNGDADIAVDTADNTFKFLYAKENQKFEIHMELEWMPK
jgi:hypothetical protein